MSKTISLVCKWMRAAAWQPGRQAGRQAANGLENHPTTHHHAPIMPKNKRTQIPHPIPLLVFVQT